MQKFKSFGAIILTAACLLTACSGNKAAEATTEENMLSTDPVSNYVFNKDTSKVYLSINGGEQKDVTEYVVNVSDGVLFLTSEGIADTFDLKYKEVTEDEEAEFKEMLSNERMLDTGGSLLCLLNDDHTLIFQDGNKMFTVDGIPAMLDSACMKLEDEKYSIPMTSLTFIFGYGSIGTSVNGDDLIYTMAQ